ncbi:hypothetical protein RGQ13_10740 [Thalassotalea psychrophila]|uniref:NlpE C-terminal OB domain-containing protein n=1 Tax=Thalassotalea psychrophila TaxID=3065647 RepID=A0ABY9TS90_9GAMM|nr:hypothetical protein RGQ13_10740 [Colwelliaceae bacterium SQ149]
MHKHILISALLLLSSVGNSTESDELYQGIFTWGPEVHSFKTCVDNADYWILVNPEVLKLKEFYHANQQQPYQGLYIEFKGEEQPKSQQGFAADYSSQITINEVLSYTFELPPICK